MVPFTPSSPSHHPANTKQGGDTQNTSLQYYCGVRKTENLSARELFKHTIISAGTLRIMNDIILSPVIANHT